jgi:uncharacterized protein
MKSNRVGAVALSTILALGGMLARAQANEPSQAVPVVPEDQQATKEQLARLFDAMRIKQQMAAMTRNMPVLMQQQFEQQVEQMKKDNPQMSSMTDDQQEAIKKVMSSFMERAMSLYPADEMIGDLTMIYQKHLSRPDVEATIAFYSSPAGQHVLDMAPVMMQEFMPTVMQKTQDRMRPMILEMTKQMAEITTSAPGK